MSQKMKGRTGGYRTGSGRAKTGYYKGIYCGSTYELVWVIYQLDHDKTFTRFDSKLEHNGKLYYPDFLQESKIIEIKGYESVESVSAKTKVAEENGYDVIVLRKEDLQQEFAWVKSKYSYKLLEELYDGFKPKYEYLCSHCSQPFYRNSKIKTNVKFCSRLCAGKGHKGRVPKENRRNQYSISH
jgi:hypothetical protein